MDSLPHGITADLIGPHLSNVDLANLSLTNRRVWGDVRGLLAERRRVIEERKRQSLIQNAWEVFRDEVERHAWQIPQLDKGEVPGDAFIRYWNSYMTWKMFPTIENLRKSLLMKSLYYASQGAMSHAFRFQRKAQRMSGIMNILGPHARVGGQGDSDGAAVSHVMPFHDEYNLGFTQANVNPFRGQDRIVKIE